MSMCRDHIVRNCDTVFARSNKYIYLATLKLDKAVHPNRVLCKLI